MHSRQAELLAQAENLAEKLAATPVLWKYTDADTGQEFFLTVRLPNVHSPFTGKSAPQHPEKYQLGEMGKELRQQHEIEDKPGKSGPVVASLIDQAGQLMAKLGAAPVLWKYVDQDTGKEFFLPSRMQNVHSPYTGKSTPQRPEKYQLAEVGKELRDSDKGVSGAPGPKSGAPKPKLKSKKKRASDDPEWKADHQADWEMTLRDPEGDEKIQIGPAGPGEQVAVAPPGWEDTVKHMKKHHEIDNPWALAWYMKDQGATPHYAASSLRVMLAAQQDMQEKEDGESSE